MTRTRHRTGRLFCRHLRAVVRPVMLVAVLSWVSACGGGGEGGGGSPRPQPVIPSVPLQRPADAGNAPVTVRDGFLHFAAGTAAPTGALPVTSSHGDVRVSHGRRSDGVARADLIAYLQADAREDTTLCLPRFGMLPPTVQVVEGATAEMVDETVRAVQLINAALPRNWQLGFSAVPSRGYDGTGGRIVVEFTARERWDVRPDDPSATGQAQRTVLLGGAIDRARVWIDPGRTAGADRLGLLVHELIHALGRNHVDPRQFPGTIMHASGSRLPREGLHPLDREALLAVYGRPFTPDVTADHVAESFGSWRSEWIHVRGDLVTAGGAVAFGAAQRRFGAAAADRRTSPWAFGPSPTANLGDNAALSGSASWSGRLLGLTPAAQAVGGAADLTIDLATLDGNLAFSELEVWPAEQAPGSAGTGARWGDGDLSYDVTVAGNTFKRTGGDAGTVTGAFFGGAHQAMGGVIERDDLAAGFGGSRQ